MPNEKLEKLKLGNTFKYEQSQTVCEMVDNKAMKIEYIQI